MITGVLGMLKVGGCVGGEDALEVEGVLEERVRRWEGVLEVSVMKGGKLACWRWRVC